MRQRFPLWLALLLSGATATAQTTETNTLPDPVMAEMTGDDRRDRAWSVGASVYTYVVPDADDYAQPTVTLDRGWLHLEARYNYEDLETGSVWIGYNFAGGEELAWEFTPLLGGVVGNTDGVAPGYRGSLSWWKLELYSEGEYVIDAHDSADSFFYNWSELTLAPTDWIRFGLVTQRTRVYETDRDIQRGLMLGLSWRALDLATYVFNPDESKPTVVIGVALTF